MKPLPHTEIAKLRASRDVRAKELADALDVTPVHLSYVENGHRQSDALVRRAVEFLSSLPEKAPAPKKTNYEKQKERETKFPHLRIKNRIIQRIGKAVKRNCAKKAHPTFVLTGCTIRYLRSHLESQFKPGMTWANYGAWHIDHIRPCASFNLLDAQQQSECFHWSNLQPLWASENCSKGSKFNASLS